jgi:hypothetical protein
VGTTSPQPVDAGRAWPGELGILKSVALASAPTGAEPYVSSFVEQSQVDKENAGCTDDLAIRELPGGAALQFVGAWDARMQSGYPLVPGPVDVKASFPFIALKSAVPGGDPFSVEARPITLTGGFEIAGEAAPKVVSPGVAADAALADARFVDWLRRHPQREWSSADLRLRDGAWTLRVGLQGGAEGSVLVDPVSGAVVAVDLP